MKINYERLEEIATMALHRMLEIDLDSAQRFMIEEIDMDKDEVDSFGVARLRTATEIEWDTDEEDAELPDEVFIPWNIFDDDIADYLSDEYGFCVRDYNVEEDD